MSKFWQFSRFSVIDMHILICVFYFDSNCLCTFAGSMVIFRKSAKKPPFDCRNKIQDLDTIYVIIQLGMFFSYILFGTMSIMSDAPTPPNGGKWELTYWM